MSLPPFPTFQHRAPGWAPHVIQWLLTIHSTHGSVYMLMLFSPFIPLFPSTTVSTSPLSISAFSFLPCKQASKPLSLILESSQTLVDQSPRGLLRHGMISLFLQPSASRITQAAWIAHIYWERNPLVSSRKAGFLNVSADIWARSNCVVKGSLVHCRIPSSNPGFCPLDASSTTTPMRHKEVSPGMVSGPLGGKPPAPFPQRTTVIKKVNKWLFKS